MPVSRRQIVRACKQRGFTIQPKALQGIQSFIGEDDDDEVLLDEILDEASAKARMEGSKILTDEIWEMVLMHRLEEGPAADVKSQTSSNSKNHLKRSKTMASPFSDDSLQLISSFEMPKLVWDVMRKQFHVQEKQGSIFGNAEDKINMLAQRYALIYQRLQRHELFRTNDLGHLHGSQQQHKLTPIESLLGKRTTNNLLLLGILVQIDEGQYYLEDPTGQVRVSFQDNALVDGFFVAESCILLVEGSFDDGIFYINRLGQPLLEERKTSLAAIQQHLSHPSFSSKTVMTDGCSFVILSDVHVDQPRVLQQLEGLLATYEPSHPNQLPMFCLMGNFSSSSTPNAPSSLDELLQLMAKFTNLARHAHFVLVPGPNDGPPVLPSPSLSQSSSISVSSSTRRIQNLHWATNPCRIRFANKEMVLFRHDLLQLMQQHQVLLQQENHDDMEAEEENDDENDNAKNDRTHYRLPHCRLVKTILDQGHLVPVAGVPIYWNYDHALRLYPIPDVLVLGGDAVGNTKSCFHEIYGGCHVLHPGSMAQNGSYAIFTPGNDDDDEDVDSDDENERTTVEFGTVGVGEY